MIRSNPSSTLSRESSSTSTMRADGNMNQVPRHHSWHNINHPHDRLLSRTPLHVLYLSLVKVSGRVQMLRQDRLTRHLLNLHRRREFLPNMNSSTSFLTAWTHRTLVCWSVNISRHSAHMLASNLGLDWNNICVHIRHHLPRGSWSLRAWRSSGWPGRHPGSKLLGRRVQSELLGVGVQTGLVQVRGRRRHAGNGTLCRGNRFR